MTENVDRTAIVKDLGDSKLLVLHVQSKTELQGVYQRVTETTDTFGEDPIPPGEMTSPFPHSDRPGAKKIWVKFRPGTQSRIVTNKYLYFRRHVVTEPGWLKIYNKDTARGVDTDLLLWPTTVIFGVEIVDPTAEDECWKCLRPRADHLTQGWSIPEGAEIQHLFDWAPVGDTRRREVYGMSSEQSYQIHVEEK